MSMFLLKLPSQIKKLVYVNKLSKEFFGICNEYIKPGVQTYIFEELCIKFCEKYKLKSAFFGYNGFPHQLCVSVNSEVIHGFPSDYILKEGDILTIDVGFIKDGFVSDNAETFIIGGGESRIVNIAYKALNKALSLIKPNIRISSISETIFNTVSVEGYDVLAGYGGHGVGFELHEDPNIPNSPTLGVDWRLRPGMVIAVEPIIISNGALFKFKSNDWTLEAIDGSISAHVERSIAVLQQKIIILMEA